MKITPEMIEGIPIQWYADKINERFPEGFEPTVENLTEVIGLNDGYVRPLLTRLLQHLPDEGRNSFRAYLRDYANLCDLVVARQSFTCLPFPVMSAIDETAWAVEEAKDIALVSAHLMEYSPKTAAPDALP